MQTVGAGSSGVTNLALTSGVEESIVFAAAYPTAVRITVVSGGPVTAAVQDRGRGTVVTAGTPRTLDARTVSTTSPTTVYLTSTGAAVVSVLGLVGDRPVADPFPTVTPPGASDPNLEARVAALEARPHIILVNAAADVPPGTPADTIVFTRSG